MAGRTKAAGRLQNNETASEPKVTKHSDPVSHKLLKVDGFVDSSRAHPLKCPRVASYGNTWR
eukprot:1088035-Prorocentrum_minimum.AAC.1